MIYKIICPFCQAMRLTEIRIGIASGKRRQCFKCEKFYTIHSPQKNKSQIVERV